MDFESYVQGCANNTLNGCGTGDCETCQYNIVRTSETQIMCHWLAAIDKEDGKITRMVRYVKRNYPSHATTCNIADKIEDYAMEQPEIKSATFPECPRTIIGVLLSRSMKKVDWREVAKYFEDRIEVPPSNSRIDLSDFIAGIGENEIVA